MEHCCPKQIVGYIFFSIILNARNSTCFEIVSVPAVDVDYVGLLEMILITPRWLDIWFQSYRPLQSLVSPGTIQLWTSWSIPRIEDLDTCINPAQYSSIMECQSRSNSTWLVNVDTP